jgi:hypothetical protein
VRHFLPTLLLTCSLAPAADLYVAPHGSDAAPGSRQRPLRSFAAAQKAARKAHGTVHFLAGTYYLPETIVFEPADSGTTFAAEPGAAVVLSGGVRLNLKWTAYRDGILQAKVPRDLATDQLFVNGERQHLARYPNYDAKAVYFDGWSPDAFGKERAARWKDPRGGYMHAMHRNLWGDFHYVITGRNAAGELTYEGGWQNNRAAPMHDKYRYVENIFEELDAPGEWFLDTKTATLYFYPPKGIDPNRAIVEAVRLRHLIEFRGTETAPVRSVTLRGFTFRHAARTFMDTREPLLRSDWAIYRGGAVLLTGTEDATIEDALFDQVGGNAIFVNNYNRRATIRGVHIDRAGANGIAFVGDPKAVRSALFFGQGKDTQDFSEIDRTPGPLTNNYPAESLVEDCLIHATGRFEKQTAPVEISMSRAITVRHCSLYDVPRAGINIGDGTWGGHTIEFCDVFDTVKETGDHGSFNSWGRDRFWGLKGIDLNTVTRGENRDLPRLDAQSPNTLRNNRWRCDHGWDIDLDDGSSNYVLVDNLCLRGGIKLREGFYRRMENNIMVGNSFHPHVWFADSKDVVRHNIVSGPYKPIRVNPPWGAECDFNLLHAPGLLAPRPAAGLQKQSGRDAHSVEADALFIDAARGDYRVRPGSPALALGFENFPMDQFGVRKPALKALARTPELPDAHDGDAATLGSTRDRTPRAWLGATVRNVAGLGEVSAAGLAGEVGVWIVEAPPGSAARAAGLRANDVVLAVDGQAVNAIDDLLRLWKGSAEVTIARDQGRIGLRVR